MNDLLAIFLATACVVVVLVSAFVTVMGFLSTLARALRRVSPENRRMGPDQVWLNLIPFFNVVWASVTVDRVAGSLHNEYVSRGLHRPDTSYGRMPGFTFLSLLLAAGLISPGLLSRDGPIVILVLMFLGITFSFWVAYWVQINSYISGLKAGTYRPPVDEEW
jgi:hypothetical protein